MAPPPPPRRGPGEAPWAQLVDPEVEVRQVRARALADGADAWVPAALWLVASDPALEVRTLGLQAVQARCRREPAALCARLLGFYIGDEDPNLSREARNALLPRDLEAALDGASRAYKQEILARLGADASLVEASARRLLRRLSIDDDAEVQDCAGWLLER